MSSETEEKQQARGLPGPAPGPLHKLQLGLHFCGTPDCEGSDPCAHPGDSSSWWVVMSNSAGVVFASSYFILFCHVWLLSLRRWLFSNEKQKQSGSRGEGGTLFYSRTWGISLEYRARTYPKPINQTLQTQRAWGVWGHVTLTHCWR